MVGSELPFEQIKPVFKAPTVARWNACKHIFKYINETLPYELTFKPSQLLNLEGYCDADWASNLDDQKSVSCICIFLERNLVTCNKNRRLWHVQYLNT